MPHPDPGFLTSYCQPAAVSPSQMAPTYFSHPPWYCAGRALLNCVDSAVSVPSELPHLCTLDPGAPHTSLPAHSYYSSLCLAVVLLSCFVCNSCLPAPAQVICPLRAETVQRWVLLPLWCMRRVLLPLWCMRSHPTSNQS